MTYYVLFFIHLGSRKMIYAGSTPNPNNLWLERTVNDLHYDDRFKGAKFLIRDNDQLYSDKFDQSFKDEKIRILKIAYKAPKMNAFAERLVRTIRQGLGPVIYGEKNFKKRIREFEGFYNNERHHQGIDGNIPEPKEDAYLSKGRVTRIARCDGRQSYYYRKTA